MTNEWKQNGLDGRGTTFQINGQSNKDEVS